MAKASIRAGYSKNVVFASDRDAGAVEATRHNAERAGVLGLKGDVEGIFDFQHSSLMGQPWFQEPASDSVPEAILICTNPPFGKRIGASTKQQSSNGLLSLYQTLGKQILHFSAGGKATKCVIITDDLKLAHRIGLPAKSRMLFRTKHGGIDVCALSWEVGPDCKE
jgi:23S rRNA G2445 N2-methylase RlmL